MKKIVVLSILGKKYRTKFLIIYIYVILIYFLGVTYSPVIDNYRYQKYLLIKPNLPNTEILLTKIQTQNYQFNILHQYITIIKKNIIKLKKLNSHLQNDTKKTIYLNILKIKSTAIGGPEYYPIYQTIFFFTLSKYQKNNYNTIGKKEEYITINSENEQIIQEKLANFLNERRSILTAIPSIWPTEGWVTSGFGHRISPWTGERQFHAGIDISTRYGSPIIAPAEGVVTFAGYEGAYGNFLVINHGHGLITRYGHLNNYIVTVGQRVKRGQLIATVGSSGRSTGSHLHYEILLFGVPANPRYYIIN